MADRSTPKPFVIPIFIPHAGCPHRCVFCNQTRTTGIDEVLPTAEQMDQTISRYLGYRRDDSRPTEISFYGGNFLGLHSDNILFLLERATRYIDAGRVRGLRFSTRPDTIDEMRLNLLAPYPVTTVELGVQSMNDNVLALSGRGHRAEDTLAAVSLLREKPYRLGLQMMVGLPGDTPELAMETGERIAALAPDFVRIYPTVVLRGSRLANWYQQGRFVPMDLEDAVALTKALYALFAQSGIKVIRMGLQATDGLNEEGDLLAGPFHPAFGELVFSALWLDALRRAIQSRGLKSQPLEIRMHPKLTSRIRGRYNSNMETLTREFTPTRIQCAADEALDLERVVLNGKTLHWLKYS